MTLPTGESADAGWTSEFVQTNGIRMHAVQQGRGRPLLFLHGLGWDHTLWTDTARRLASRYRVIAGDTRGHGRSDKPGGPYTLAMLVADWQGLVARLAAEPACLVGFSLGGMIATALALEHPGHVAALVLASTLCETDPDVSDKLEARIKTARQEGPVAGARLGARQIFSQRFMVAHPEAIERFVAWRAAMEQEPLWDAARTVYGFRLCERLREIRVPSLVMYGSEDAITPPAVVQRIVDSLPGARTVGFPRTGHMLPVERPREFADALTSFLSAHYSPALP